MSGHDSAPAAAPKDAPAPGASSASGWVLFFAGILGGGAAGFATAQLALQPVREALAGRPPVVVQDMAAALVTVDPEDVAVVIGEQQRLARRLGEAGALVLDADAVLAAPAVLYVNRKASVESNR